VWQFAKVEDARTNAFIEAAEAEFEPKAQTLLPVEEAPQTQYNELVTAVPDAEPTLYEHVVVQVAKLLSVEVEYKVQQTPLIVMPPEHKRKLASETTLVPSAREK